MNLESLQSRRSWLAGGALVALLIIAVSYFLVISPKLGDASDTRSQAQDNDVLNVSLASRHGALVRQQTGLPAMRAALAAALKALPPTSALPEFTHEATQAAASTGVSLRNISISALTPVTSTSAAPASSAPASSTTTPTTGSAPATPSQYQVGVTLTTSGPTDKQLAFVDAIENGPRRALVMSTSFTGTGSKASLTSQLTIFTAPMTTQQIAQLHTLLGSG